MYPPTPQLPHSIFGREGASRTKSLVESGAAERLAPVVRLLWIVGGNEEERGIAN